MDDPREVAYMRHAIELSAQACATARAGLSVLSSSRTTRSSRRVLRQIAEHDCTWHAEIHAIREAGRVLKTHDLTGCSIYCSSEPCPMCAFAISLARMEQIVYGAPAFPDRLWAGFKHPFTAEQAALPILRRSLPARQMMTEEALRILNQEKTHP